MLSSNNNKITPLMRSAAKEVIFNPIDLTPLMNAVRAGDWDYVNELIEQGYSLQWLDHKTNQSVIQMIAAEQTTDLIGPEELLSHPVVKLMELATRDNHVDSATSAFICLEAMRGAVRGDHQSLVRWLTHMLGQDNFDFCFDQLYAVSKIGTKEFYLCDSEEMEAKYISPIGIATLGQYGYFRQALFQLIKVIKHFNDLYAPVDGEIKNTKIKEMIAAYLRGALLNQKRDLNDVITKLNQALDAEFGKSKSNQKSNYAELISRMAIAETAAAGHIETAIEMLNEFYKVRHPDLDIILGEAIISAARQDRMDVIFRLCDYAKHTGDDQSPRFINLLSSAVGAALVKEYFSLAKVLMRMVPEFHALPDDLKELNSWPETKIARMFHSIRDYKIFTDIALHCGLASNIDSRAWASALKKEYGLGELSSDGFASMVHHPEIIQLLQQYRSNKGNNMNQPLFPKEMLEMLAMNVPDVKFTEKDVSCFLQVMESARAEAANPQHDHISFFRINCLTTPPTHQRATADEMKLCMEMRQKIIAILKSGYNFMSRKVPDEIVKLYSDLNDAVSTGAIYKLVKSHLKAMQHPILLARCTQVLNDPRYQGHESMKNAKAALKK